jgi:hypothetical protein
VKVGRRAEVLATGLRRLRDAQCRAEAHAATLPEVAAALEKQAAEESTSAPRTKKERPPKTQAPPTEPSVGEVADGDLPPLTYERVSDGCICGKIESGTWVAGPSGTVSVPSGTDPAVAQQICRVAANHYTALQAKPSPASQTKSTAKASTKTAKREHEDTARSKPGRGPKFTPKPFSGIDAPPGASLGGA